jgi:hypothetical protein
VTTAQSAEARAQQRHRFEPLVVFTFVLVAIGLQLLVAGDLSEVTSLWLPVIELVLFVPVAILGVLQFRGRTNLPWARYLTIAFILLMLLTTMLGLLFVFDELLAGRVQDGRALIISGVKLWGTLIISSGLVYWELDRGGPLDRMHDAEATQHFRFPQDEHPAKFPHWRPTFIDYFYVAVTNSTAFSPTDAMPLTHRAKLVMGLEAGVSAATVLVVAARAINILGS